MSGENWFKAAAVQLLIDETVKDIVRRYRIDATKAKELVEHRMSLMPALAQVVAREQTAERIKRTRIFKDIVVDIKKSIYYNLRRYSTDNDKQEELIIRLSQAAGCSKATISGLAEELAQTHASTKERFTDRDEFYRQLFAELNCPRTILDIGCGLQPLLFPWASLNLEWGYYLAADKDPMAVTAVKAYAQAVGERRLNSLVWDLAEGWSPIRATSGVNLFDVAFLFKIVPFIARQKPALLPILHLTPARRLVLTGSRQSLTKRQNIERRERSVLDDFCRASGRKVTAEFAVAEEFVMILDEA